MDKIHGVIDLEAYKTSNAVIIILQPKPRSALETLHTYFKGIARELHYF